MSEPKGEFIDGVDVEEEEAPNTEQVSSRDTDGIAQKEAEVAEREAKIKTAQASIEKREKELAQKQVKLDVDQLVKDARIRGNQRSAFEQIAQHLLDNDVKIKLEGEKGEAEEVSAYSAMVKMAQSNVKQVEFEEIAKTGDEPPESDFSNPEVMSAVLVKVQEKEGLTSDEAYMFVKQNGIPPYAIAKNGE